MTTTFTPPPTPGSPRARLTAVLPNTGTGTGAPAPTITTDQKTGTITITPRPVHYEAIVTVTGTSLPDIAAQLRATADEIATASPAALLTTPTPGETT